MQLDFFFGGCINILLLLQQGGKTDKCSNYAFMCVLFQACVVLWRRFCCVCTKRLHNCSENSWDFSDIYIYIFFFFSPEWRQNLMLLSVIKEYSCFLIKYVAWSLGAFKSKVGIILPYVIGLFWASDEGGVWWSLGIIQDCSHLLDKSC